MKLPILIPATLVAMVAGEICPDGSWCILQTCCKMQNGWGCCPLQWAECCSDGLHCCPQGYVCDVVDGLCYRAVAEVIPWIKKVKSHKPSQRLVSKVDAGPICPGGNQTCPSGYTCCGMEQGGFGCCPLKNAVCCADQLHCCPAGTVCDTADWSCIKEKGPKEEGSAEDLILSKEKETGKEKIVCPNKNDRCRDGETCCLMKSGRYGCCPYPQATCCPDKETCCPHNMECSPNQTCIPNKKTVPYPFSAAIYNHPNDIPV